VKGEEDENAGLQERPPDEMLHVRHGHDSGRREAVEKETGGVLLAMRPAPGHEAVHVSGVDGEIGGRRPRQQSPGRNAPKK
jgi:hypothetical protein